MAKYKRKPAPAKAPVEPVKEKEKEAESLVSQNDYQPMGWRRWSIAVVALAMILLAILIVVDSVWLDKYRLGFTIPALAILFLVLLPLVCLRWTYVQESTAKAITRFGSFKRIVFSKKDYQINSKTGEISHVPGHQDGFLGGLRFYIWPLEEVYEYTWEWIKSLPNGQIVEKPEETVDFILTLQYYSYGLRVVGKGIVTLDKIPLELVVTLTARIINPYLAMFNVKNWFDTFIGRVQPAIREYINAHDYAFIISDNDNKTFLDEEITKVLEARGILKELRDMLGVELAKLEFREVKVTDEYQEMMTKEKKGQMEAKERTASTTGAFLEMLAHEILGEPTGTTPEEQEEYAGEMAKIRAEYKKDPAAFEKKHAASIKRIDQWINRQIDAKAGALKSYHFVGAKGGMDLIALLGDALRGGGGDGPDGRSDDPDNTSKKKNPPKDEDEDDEDDDEPI